MNTCSELPTKGHFNVYICIILRSVHATKKISGTSLLAETLICRKSLDNLVLFLTCFNMCLFHMHVWQENALQSNMVIVPFSPKPVSRPVAGVKNTRQISTILLSRGGLLTSGK